MGLTLREQLLLWWGRLHIGEVIRRRALRRALAPLLQSGVHILDAGCGRGDLALWIARRYPEAQVDAADIDIKLVELVGRRIEASGLRNVSAKIRNIERETSLSPTSSPSPRGGEGEKKEERYGIIYSVDVFEHLKDPAQALVNLVGALAPGGMLLIHVPHRTQRRFFRRFVHYDQHDHERDGFEPEELMALVQNVRTPEVELAPTGTSGEEQGDGKTSGVQLEVIEVRHTFGPPGALAWELFHLAQGIGKWFALLTYPIPWLLATVDGWCRWKRGNGMLVVAQRQ